MAGLRSKTQYFWASIFKHQGIQMPPDDLSRDPDNQRHFTQESLAADPSTNADRHGYIESYGTYLPETEESSYKTSRSVKNLRYVPLREATGIRRRRVTHTHSSFDLAKKAVEKCLARSSYLPGEIDLLINCNICKSSADGRLVECEPSQSVKMAHEFGISHATTFDLNNACAGMFTGLYLANKLIATGAIRRALIFSGERISHLAETAKKEITGLRDPRLACLTLGDAGAAIILDATSDPKIGLQYFDFRTLTNHSRLCLGFPTDQPHGGIIMHTQSRAITHHGRDETAKIWRQLIQHKGAPISSKAVVIHHQVASRLLTQFVDKVNDNSPRRSVRLKQLINNVKHIGNTASTSHVLALARGIADRRIKSRGEVVFLISASGLNVGVAHCLLGDLPKRIVGAKKLGNKGRASAINVAQSSCKQGGRQAGLVIERIEVETRQDHDTVTTTVDTVNRCFANDRIKADTVRYLIHAGQYRSNHLEEPAHAPMIAGDAGLSASEAESRFFCFDVVNGALGWLNAAYVASHMVAPEGGDRIIVTTSEAAEEMQLRGSDSLTHTGTSVATSLRACEGGRGFSSFHFRSFEDGANLFEVNIDLNSIPPGVVRHISNDFADKVIDACTHASKEHLENLGCAIDDFRAFVFPQISTEFISKLAVRLGVNGRIIADVTKNTNHVSNGIPLAVQQLLMHPGLTGGDRILVVGATAGIQVGVSVYTI